MTNGELEHQIELFPVDSPCRGVCESSRKGFCKGCLRSRDERFYWHSLNDEDKRKVLQLCKQRRQRLLRARQEKQMADEEASLPYGMEEQDLFD